MNTSRLLISALLLSLSPGSVTSPTASVLSQLQAAIQDQSTTTAHLAEIINDVADHFNYRSVNIYEVKPDEWEADDRRLLLITHAYYDLYSRDPDSLVKSYGPIEAGVSSKHIMVAILLFKDADLVGNALFLLQKKMEDNIGAKVLKADENGFEVTTAVSGNEIALRRGTKVILLKTDKQTETMQAMAEKIEQASW